jgi:hypothetical protein
MKRLIPILAALAMLAGCAQLKNAYDTVTGAHVSPKLVIVAANAFNAVEATATNYITYCTPNPSPAGCSDTAIKQMIPAVRSGRDARNALEAFLKTHPDAIGAQGLYDALVSATGTLNSVISEYNVKG